jgi:hypothetical protein
MGNSIFEGNKRFGIVLVGMLLALSSLSEKANAFNIVRNITVEITEGPLIGNKYFGRLSFDNSSITGVGEELITPANGNINVDFTFIDSNLMPKTYTQLDAILAPEFPRVDYENGEFIGLVFSSNILGGSGSFGFLDVFDYSLTGFEAFEGTVVYSSEPVPFEFSPVLGLVILFAMDSTRKVFYKNNKK